MCTHTCLCACVNVCVREIHLEMHYVFEREMRLFALFCLSISLHFLCAHVSSYAHLPFCSYLSVYDTHQCDPA
jgi:hypothetical protein